MGKVKIPNVTQLLQEAHERMKQQFGDTQANAEEMQAKIIENFLRQIKIRASNRRNGNPAQDFNEDIYDQILDSIVLKNGRTLYNLFQRTGHTNAQQGQYFEDDFAALLAAVVNVIEEPKTKITAKEFSVGQSTGTTGIDLNQIVEDEIITPFKEQVLEKTAEELQRNNPSYVFGKIDTRVNKEIINVNGRIDLPEGLLEALSNATFTDKSYRSISWKNGSQISLGDREITLGNSDLYRALSGSLSALGFSFKDIQYIFYGGENISFGKDDTPPTENSIEVRQHIYHLRFMYELTGAGIVYKDFGNELFGGAKFLVYNDPTSLDITVVSTRKIISDLIFNTNYEMNNPYGRISISSSKLKSMS